MAIAKPNLDEITTPLDSIVGSLDDDDVLIRLDFTRQFTMDELDDLISNLDALDVYGNLDSIPAFDVTSAAATANVAVTGTATIQVPVLAQAAASIAVTATNAFTRIRGVSASVTGAVTFAATASFIARMSASASVAVTATNVAGRIRPVSAAASVTASGTATGVRVWRSRQTRMQPSRQVGQPSQCSAVRQRPRQQLPPSSLPRYRARIGRLYLLATRRGQSKRLAQRFGPRSLAILGIG